VLVCFPYAGGNAVNFQPMAKALKDSGLAVYAVELPGHDLGTGGTGVEAGYEPFVSTDAVISQVVEEIGALTSGVASRQVMLWGHSAGSALAIEAARRLSDAGVNLARVFVGAQLLGDAATRQARIDELGGRSDGEIAAALSSDSGYVGLAELDSRGAEHVGAAYRHDYVNANRYFVEVLGQPPSRRLTVPVTVVVAADDPSTSAYRDRYGDWGLLAEKVELHEIASGGHYFLRTRPEEAARAVLGTTALFAR
jgi:surfactin synthase thioesterase subunit